MEKNQKFNKADVNEVSVHVIWPLVEVFTDDKDEIKIIVAGDKHSVDNLSITLENGKLDIEQPQLGINVNLNESRWLQICIQMPIDFKKKVAFSTAVSKLHVRGINASQISLDTVSGEISAFNLNADKISLRSVNGGIKASDIKADSIFARVINSSIHLRQVIAKNIRLNAVTGQQMLECSEPFEKLEITAVTGDVFITQPSEEINASLRALNGQLKTENVKIGDLGPKLSATTVVGNIHINRNIKLNS